MRASAALTVSLLALFGCRPSPEDCRRLFDHFLDVEGVAATQGHFRDMTEPLKQALAARKRAFQVSLAPEFTAKCRSYLSRGEVACALAAADDEGMDRCMQASEGRR